MADSPLKKFINGHLKWIWDSEGACCDYELAHAKTQEEREEINKRYGAMAAIEYGEGRPR